ncbi:MAG TPA: hypothetical protein VH599_19070 [Ktedonobacterales bacterium]|jgi:hypothetical protein
MRSVKRRWAGARLLATNIVRVRRFRLLRFRLITFGLYEPHALYRRRVFARPWRQVNPRVAWLLLWRTAAYSRWLAEMEAVRQSGPAGWWQHRLEPAAYERLRQWIDAENTPPPGSAIE